MVTWLAVIPDPGGKEKIKINYYCRTHTQPESMHRLKNL